MSQHHPSSSVGPLHPPTFGLRAVFWLITATAVVIAVGRLLDPRLSAFLALFGLAIFAHVAGNAVGSRLRNHKPPTGSTEKQPRLNQDDFAPSTRLSQRHPLSRRLIWVTVIGGMTGASVGAGLLTLLARASVTVANLGLALFSGAVLGALGGFWLSSFLLVVFRAWREAHEASCRNDAR